MTPARRPAIQRPTFLVVEHQPVYCQITDGIIGAQSRTVDAGRTYGHALASARRRSHIEYNGFGDGSFHVMVRDEAGRLRHYNPNPAPVADLDDMPF